MENATLNPALEAKSFVQELSFYPIMFQAAYTLKKVGILEYMHSKRRTANPSVTPEEVNAELGVPRYGVKLLLDTALSMDLVSVEDLDHYTLTAKGVMLLLDKQTEVNMNFVNDVCYVGMFKLPESIQNEKPEGLKHFGEWPTIYEGLRHLPQDVRKSWFEFDHYYSDGAFPLALEKVFAHKPKHLVDVGGNTGKWSIMCCQHDPEVRITIADLPGQLEDAKKNVAANGFGERVSMFETNVLKDDFPFPEGPDAIWMSQFLDCFSEDEIVRILSNAAKHMAPHTRLHILETYWDHQEHPSSTYCLQGTSLYFTALANGNSKMYHSQEMKACIKRAGLKLEGEGERVGDFHTLFTCRSV